MNKLRDIADFIYGLGEQRSTVLFCTYKTMFHRKLGGVLKTIELKSNVSEYI